MSDPSRKSSYRPELDVLRFSAFFGVYLFHSIPKDPTFYAGHHALSRIGPIAVLVAGSGGFGVDLFFVLSAYLITTLLLREKETLGELDVRSFWIRRILRIWPLYFFFIGLACILPYIDRTQHVGWAYALSYIFLAGNWICALKGTPNSVITPLWSVSIEEQFYLIWPLAVRKMS